jgi:hypothetical protein
MQQPDKAQEALRNRMTPFIESSADASYVSYLEYCGMKPGVLSEYVLYEPVLRILRTRRYT